MGNSCLKGASYTPGDAHSHGDSTSGGINVMPGEGGKGKRSYKISSAGDFGNTELKSFTNGKLVLDSTELPFTSNDEYINTDLAYSNGQKQNNSSKESLVDNFFEAKEVASGQDNKAFDETENTLTNVTPLENTATSNFNDSTGFEITVTDDADIPPSDTSDVSDTAATYDVATMDTTAETFMTTEATYNVSTASTLAMNDERELSEPAPDYSPASSVKDFTQHDIAQESDMNNSPISSHKDYESNITQNVVIESDYTLTDTPTQNSDNTETFGAVPYEIETTTGSLRPVSDSAMQNSLFYNETTEDDHPPIHLPEMDFTINSEINTDSVNVEASESVNVFNLPPPPVDFISYSPEENREIEELVVKIHTIQDNIGSAVNDINKSNEEKIVTVLESLFAMTAFRDELSTKDGNHEEMFVMEEIELPMGYEIEDNISNENDLRNWYGEAVATLNTEVAAKIVATSESKYHLMEHKKDHSHLWKLKEVEMRELHDRSTSVAEDRSHDDVRDRYEIMGRYNELIKESDVEATSSSTPSLSSCSEDESEELQEVQVLVETVKDYIRSKRDNEVNDVGVGAQVEVSSQGVGGDGPITSDASVATESLVDLEEQMKTLDVGVMVQIENDLEKNGDDDDLVAQNVRNILQTHMESASKLRQNHHDQMAKHQVLLREKLRRKSNNNQDDQDSGDDTIEEHYSRASRQLDDIYMGKLASSDLDIDKETVEELLSQYRNEHITLLKLKEKQRERMNEKLEERLAMRSNGHDDPYEDSKDDLLAKIWDIERENSLTDEEILNMIKQHIAAKRKTKRRSKHFHENAAAEYLKQDQEHRSKLRKLRDEEKAKADEKLLEKLQRRKITPNYNDTPDIPLPRKKKIIPPAELRDQGAYENVELKVEPR